MFPEIVSVIEALAINSYLIIQEPIYRKGGDDKKK
jgi:hypothetical protein